MTRLVLMWKEKDLVHEFPVPDKREITLGRYKCDITLSQQTISRQHASIVPQGDSYYLHNLSHVNPVIINEDTTLSFGQKALIEPGDNFRLGPVAIMVLKTSLENLSPKLKCSNCGNVNEYNPEEQCKYCGRNLSSGITIMLQG